LPALLQDSRLSDTTQPMVGRETEMAKHPQMAS
jgi:hypothetical protein